MILAEDSKGARESPAAATDAILKDSESAKRELKEPLMDSQLSDERSESEMGQPGEANAVLMKTVEKARGTWDQDNGTSMPVK